jgi:predicted neutral ceramidase superfamily lipid hydrolase
MNPASSSEGDFVAPPRESEPHQPPGSAIELLAKVISSSEMTNRLIRLLAAVFAALTLLISVLALFAVYVIYPAIKSDSSGTLAVVTGFVSATLGSSVGLAAAYRRKRTDTKALVNLEKALQAETLAKGQPGNDEAES